MAARIAVFVDGRNVHYGLRQLGWPRLYDVGVFGRAIAGNNTLGLVHYYNATPMQKYTTGPEYARQLDYYDAIDATPGVIFKKGYLMDAGPKPVEKLVDVMLALDLALGAYRDEYDIAALVSADGDFQPAIEEAQAAGKRVINFVFRNRRSFRLATSCDEVRFLKRKHFIPVVF